MRVSVFGNQELASDSLPVKLLPQLKKLLPQIEFIHQDPNEECQPPDTKEWWIIDTVRGMSEVKLIADVAGLKSPPRVTAHDYDLGTQLKLLKKINPDLKVRIIGVPEKGEIPELARQVTDILLKVQASFE